MVPRVRRFEPRDGVKTDTITLVFVVYSPITQHKGVREKKSVNLG
jgi:hypothetical protein